MIDVTQHQRLAPKPEMQQVFRTGLEQGRLLLPHCSSCGRTHWYPRELCPSCHTPIDEWQSASGVGEIYALTVLYGKDGPQKTIAYVNLAEQVTVLGQLLSVNDRSLIGHAVQLDAIATKASGSLVFRLKRQSIESLKEVKND